jgi:hypothetical protein
VVRICVEICDPREDMSVYDPTVGSGGMLIQVRDYVRECGGDPGELSLFGQEKMGTTWSICKMNMLLHGISHADIRQQDTLREPQHTVDDQPTATLRPRAGQSALQPELHQKGNQVPRPLPGLHAGEGQEGRPDVRPAHAGRAQGRRPTGHRDAARRAVPRRRGARGAAPLHRQGLPRSRDRPAQQPVLRHRHPRLHPGA